MHYILIFSLILFTLTGCQDKEQVKKEQLMMINKAKEELRTTFEQALLEKESLFQKRLAQKDKEIEELKNKLSVIQEKLQTLQQQLKAQETLLQKQKNLTKTGVLIDGDTLIIDANKTQTYFKTLAQQLKAKLLRLENDLKKGMIQEKDAGIEIDESHINIDLNKTKTLIEVWGKKIQEIAKDFDTNPHIENKNIH